MQQHASSPQHLPPLPSQALLLLPLVCQALPLAALIAALRRCGGVWLQ
jgi:hypothetical protein